MSDVEESATVATFTQLPPFWSTRPHAWFAHVEAQFELKRIVSQRTRYNHVVVSLTPELADEVEDIISSPPSETPYDILKEAILKRTSLSDRQRSQELFKHLDLGDRKPSQLYRHMCHLLGGKKMDDSLFRQLWLSKLPAQIQGSLASVDDLSLERQAAIADSIFEAVKPTVSHMATTSAAPDVMKHIEELYREVMSLRQAQNESRGRPVSPARNNPRNRSRPKSWNRFKGKGLCWYHAKFGPKARRCLKPCSFEGPLAPASPEN